jgi:hypothetical protein
MRSLEDPGVRNPSLDSSLSLWPILTPPTAAAENPVLGTQLRIRVGRADPRITPHFVSRRPFFYPQHQHFASPVAQAVLNSLKLVCWRLANRDSARICSKLLSHAGSAMTNKVEVQQLAPNPATNHSMSKSSAQEASPSSEVAAFDLKLGQTDEPLAVLPFLSVQHSFWSSRSSSSLCALFLWEFLTVTWKLSERLLPEAAA